MPPDSKAHGETALIIRNNIRYYEIDKHQKYFLQARSSVVEMWNGCIIISAVYSLSKHVVKSKQYITFLETLYDHFISTGDYNKHMK